MTPGGGSSRLRFFSMKRTASQHSFDTTSVDGSGPEDGLSVDSDGSDGFVMLTDSGNERLALSSSSCSFPTSEQFSATGNRVTLCSYRTCLCRSCLKSGVVHPQWLFLLAEVPLLGGEGDPCTPQRAPGLRVCAGGWMVPSPEEGSGRAGWREGTLSASVAAFRSSSLA